MYYIIERQYAGPNAKNLATDRKNIVDGHQYVVRSEPGVTNMSHEPRTSGWLGTTCGWSEHAQGAYETEQEAVEAATRLAEAFGHGHRVEEDPEGNTVILVGDEALANLWDAGYWMEPSHNEELGITSGMSDDDIANLASELEAEALEDGCRLWGTEEAIRYRVEAIRYRVESLEEDED